MSKSNAAAFMDLVDADEALANELSALKADPAAVQARVHELGFDATPDEIRDEFLEHYGAALTEEQLVSVSGGLDDVTYAFLMTFGIQLVLGAAAAAAAF